MKTKKCGREAPITPPNPFCPNLVLRPPAAGPCLQLAGVWVSAHQHQEEHLHPVLSISFNCRDPQGWAEPHGSARLQPCNCPA